MPNTADCPGPRWSTIPERNEPANCTPLRLNGGSTVGQPKLLGSQTQGLRVLLDGGPNCQPLVQLPTVDARTLSVGALASRCRCRLAWGFEAGTKMSTFAHRGHRGAPSHALGTHRHQSRFRRHFRGTFGHFRGNFSDFQGQKPENRGKSGTPENNCPTPRFTADCFAWGSRRQKIYGTRRWRDFKIFRI